MEMGSVAFMQIFYNFQEVYFISQILGHECFTIQEGICVFNIVSMAWRNFFTHLQRLTSASKIYLLNKIKIF